MSAQASLFDAGPLTLIADAEGGVRYWPGVLDPATARDWFARLQREAPWESARRPMYDRIVDVPRLLASIDLQAPDCPSLLREALACVRGVVAAPFTRVGLNLYRDGRDSVAPHNDRLHNLAPGQPIAILSLGAPRSMVIRAKQGGRSWRLPLEPGSVLAMSHASQSVYDHGIPKCSGDVGPRISCAFRVRVG